MNDFAAALAALTEPHKTELVMTGSTTVTEGTPVSTTAPEPHSAQIWQSVKLADGNQATAAKLATAAQYSPAELKALDDAHREAAETEPAPFDGGKPKPPKGSVDLTSYSDWLAKLRDAKRQVTDAEAAVKEAEDMLAGMLPSESADVLVNGKRWARRTKYKGRSSVDTKAMAAAGHQDLVEQYTKTGRPYFVWKWDD